MADAKRYAEDTGIRIAVKAPGGLSTIEKLVLIKIDN